MSKQTKGTLSKRVVGGALLAAGGALVALKAGGKLARALKPKGVPLPKAPRPEPEALSRMEGEGGGSTLDLEKVVPKP